MRATIKPSEVYGGIAAPASKSAMQRACAAALIKGGTSILHNPGSSADDQAALDIIKKLGASVEGSSNGDIVITSNGVRPAFNTIHCGESGLSVRMFTSIAATSDRELVITGAGSLLKRPLSFFDKVLPQLGVQCSSRNGYLPLEIVGPLVPKNIEVDGSLSSQFLTGLLFAYAAADASSISIRVVGLNSKPYVDLTLAVMEAFGLKTPVNLGYKEFFFPAQSTATFQNASVTFTVEGDWSGGAFLLVAGCVSGHLRVKGLDVLSTQADKAVLNALKSAGASVVVSSDDISVQQAELVAFSFDATDCPDLFPPLVALASYCKGISVITGVERLTHKESDRGATLREEFGKMGVHIELLGNEMRIHGTNTINSAQVHSHHDHRIAMACAVAGLGAVGEIVIDGAEAVSKSYPDFWDHLRKIGVSVSLINN